MRRSLEAAQVKESYYDSKLPGQKQSHYSNLPMYKLQGAFGEYVMVNRPIESLTALQPKRNNAQTLLKN